MSDIEYREIDVKDLPPPAYSGGIQRGFTLLLRKLPEGRAVLRPRGKSSSLKVATSSASSMATLLKRDFPDRAYHTRQDREDDGVWVWWTPRENGRKP